MTLYFISAMFVWIMSPVIAVVVMLAHAAVNKPQAEKYARSEFWFICLSSLIVAALLFVVSLFG